MIPKKAISNKSRVVEYYADFLIYSLSIPMYVAVLLFVYYLWEADAKEEEKGPSLNKIFEFFIGLHRCCQHACQQQHRSHYMILPKKIIFIDFLLNSSTARAKPATERIDTTLETISNLESPLGHWDVLLFLI